MADKFTERALRSQRERHESQIRQSAECIREYAGYILARLDAGTIPPGFDLIADAAEIRQRIFALEAIKDTSGIYEAEAGGSREDIATEIERTVGGYPGNEVARPKVGVGEYVNDWQWAAQIVRERLGER